MDEDLDDRIRRELEGMVDDRRSALVVRSVVAAVPHTAQERRSARRHRLTAPVGASLAAASAAALLLFVVPRIAPDPGLGDRASVPVGTAGATASAPVSPSLAPSAARMTPGRTMTATPTTAPSSSLTPVAVDARAYLRSKWPARTNSADGTLDTSAYDADPPQRLTDWPRVDGPFVEERMASVLSGSTFAAVRTLEQLVNTSRLIVRGRSVAFSRPYFASDDGGYWDPAVARVNVRPLLQQDVLFEVEEVLGSALPWQVEPGLIEFTVQAGQAVVTVPAGEAGGGGGRAKPGRYLHRTGPARDHVLGQEEVLLLDYQPLDGLYSGRLGYETRLTYAYPPAYAFIVEGERLVGAPASYNPFRPTLAELRALAQRLPETRGTWGVLPDGRPHIGEPPAADGQPPPSPCVIESDRDVLDTLDAIIAASSTVVVGRPATVGREHSRSSDGGFVHLAQETVVELGLSGAASRGEVLRVSRTVTDGGCEIAVEEVSLRLERAYLLFLRAGAPSGVHGVVAAFRVRDGRVVAPNIAELHGRALHELLAAAP